jgi:ribonuclease HII/Holliday junction resolvase-like predicted endonuclease
VILPAGSHIPGVTDSKALSDSRRRSLCQDVLEAAAGVSTGTVSPGEIDSSGMSAAVTASFRRAAEGLATPVDMFLVDGNPVRDLDIPCRFLVKGDSRSLSIAAASIVAKVTRDDMMLRSHELYPEYGFDTNKGYGTPEHLRALSVHGPCPLHRRSFAPLREGRPAGQLSLALEGGGDSRPVWKRAEDYVAGELESAGWKLEARNYAPGCGEVDVIARMGDTVAFVEVKYSSPGMKHRQTEKLALRGAEGMMKAAAEWMGKSGFTGACRFDLALVTDGAAGFEMEYREGAFEPPDGLLL